MYTEFIDSMNVITHFVLCIGAIPVYWGAPDVDQYINPAAFINCNQFDTLPQCARYIVEVNGNDTLYHSMIHAPFFKDQVEVEGDGQDGHIGNSGQGIDSTFQSSESTKGSTTNAVGVPSQSNDMLSCRHMQREDGNDNGINKCKKELIWERLFAWHPDARNVDSGPQHHTGEHCGRCEGDAYRDFQNMVLSSIHL